MDAMSDPRLDEYRQLDDEDNAVVAGLMELVKESRVGEDILEDPGPDEPDEEEG